MKKPTLTIRKATTTNYFAEMTAIQGQGCNHTTGYGVNGLQVDYDVSIFNGEKIQDFHLVMQTLDRTDNLMAYNGVEMTSAGKYGVDGDQTGQAYDFLTEVGADADEILSVVQADAQMRCRAWFNENIALLLNPMYAPAEDEQEQDLSLVPAVIDHFKHYPDIGLYDEEQVIAIIEFACNNLLREQVKGEVDYQFSVSENVVGFEKLVNTALAYRDQAYDDMGNNGETDLTDDEIKANFHNEDLVFVNVFERALKKTENMNNPYFPNNKQVYVAFYKELWRLVNGGEGEVAVNTWHVEQNDLKPIGERDSIRQLCYAQVANIINTETAA